MSVNVTVNGGVFTVPELGDSDWGIYTTALLVAVATTTLQKSGGTFSLTAEVDFGSSYGIKSLYYKSRTANVASSGEIRLARPDSINWRNQANNANLALAVNSSDQLTYNGNVIEASVDDAAIVSDSSNLVVTSGSSTITLSPSATPTYTSVTTGRLLAASGSLSAPSIAFSDGPTKGWYLKSDGHVALAFDGADALHITDTHADFDGVLRTPDGSASIPSRSYTNDTNLGDHRVSENVMAFTAGGVDRVTISGASAATHGMGIDGNLTVTGTVAAVSGTLTNGLNTNSIRLTGASSLSAAADLTITAGDDLTISADQTNGSVTITSDGVNGSVSISAANTNGYLQFSANDFIDFTSGSAVSFDNQLQLSDGTAGAPGLAFALEPTTGLNRITGGVLGLAADGQNIVQVSGVAASPGTKGVAVDGNLVVTGTLTAGTFELLEELPPFYNEIPSSGTITLLEHAFYKRRINSLVVQTSAGTISGSITKNGIGIAGLSNNQFTSTKQTFTPTSSTTLEVGDLLTLTLSGAQSAYNLAGVVSTIRTT